MSETDSQGADRIGTPANIVTIVRILCVPLFVASMLCPWPLLFGGGQDMQDFQPVVAAALFIVLSATDTLDGYLARSRNEVTTFGKFLDPLADKILVICAMLALVELGTLPSWVPMVVAVREFIISGLRMLAASKGVVIAASWFGKWKTAVTMVATVFFIVKDSAPIMSFGAAFAQGFNVLSWVLMIAAVALTIISMIDYLAKSAPMFSGREAKR